MELYLNIATLPIVEEIVLFVRTGGLMIIPLIILSFGMWILITQRFLSLFNEQQKFDNGKRSSLLTTNNNPPKDNENREIEFYLNAKERESHLKKNIALIRQCVSIAPLLGLLGTVTGMIEVFEVLKIHGTSNSVLIGKGFSHATIPTMFGLAIAISGFFALTFLETMIKNRIKDSKKVVAGV